MSILNNRGKGLEKTASLDEASQFARLAKRNKILGTWAAEVLKKGNNTDDYVLSVMHADLEEKGDDDVIRKLVDDFAKANLRISRDEIEAKIAEIEEQLPL